MSSTRMSPCLYTNVCDCLFLSRDSSKSSKISYTAPLKTLLRNKAITQQKQQSWFYILTKSKFKRNTDQARGQEGISKPSDE